MIKMISFSLGALALCLQSFQVKNKADLIIKGGTIVTMDKEYRVIEDGMIIIQNGTVSAVGTKEDLEKLFEAEEVIDAEGKLIIPGLINTHTHVPMTLFRGLADDIKLEEWLQNHIFPAEAQFVNEEFVRVGTRLGIAEMIKGGITTYCDMYYYEDAIADETAKAGMRGVLAQSIIDFPAPGYNTTEQAFDHTEQFLQKWKDHPLIVPAIGPHAPYTVSTDNLKKAKALSDKTLAPIVIHISETSKEVEAISKQYGNSPVNYLSAINFLNERTILAHAVHVSDQEIDKISQHRCGIAHCPESNMKLASGIAPIPRMLIKGIPVGLGTDGAASNNDLNLWDEMDMAAKLHKVHTGNPETVPAIEAFAMATIKGAQALHIDHLTGSIEEGKKADITIIDIDGLHQQPIYNVYSCLVYATKASDVRTVLVDGKILMKDRVLTTLDETDILTKALAYKQSIVKKIKTLNTH